MFLRAHPAPQISAVISIHGKREFGVELAYEHRLDLTFDDVEVAAPDDLMAMQHAMSRKRWAEQNGFKTTMLDYQEGHPAGRLYSGEQLRDRLEATC